jgi:alpha-tubulin suppressor-like RCC1 family protein
MICRTRLACLVLLAATAGCIDGFPSAPPLLVAIPDTIAGYSALHVTDTVRLEAVFVDGTGARLTDLKVEWQSSDSSIATVARLTAPSGRHDSLRARVVARRSGTVSIVATVVHPGFEHTSGVLTVTIGPWGMAPVGAWPGALSATETDTVQVFIPNANAAIVNDLRVQWQSTDESRVRVTRLIPPTDPTAAELLDSKRTAILTALRRGPAQVVVTVERPGFEASEVRALILVDTLTIAPTGPWPDTLMVGDSVLLSVAVLNSRGTALTGRQVVWLTNDTSRLTPRPAGPYEVYARADARGMPNLVATVGGGEFDASSTQHDFRIMERWIAVSAGVDHTCAINWNHEGYCWGAGSHGALGNGRSADAPVPSRVAGLADLRFLQIRAGEEVTCAAPVEGGAFCWGRGTLGRLGNNDASEVDQFAPVPVSGGHAFVSASANRATCAVTVTHQALCWGDNTNWQLAHDTGNIFLPALDHCGANKLTECSLTPRPVSTPTGTPTTYASVDVGGTNACGISFSNRRVFCWGKHALGGTAPGDSSPIPVAISSSSAFRSVAAGNEHACGVTTLDLAFCWGTGSFGQLGTGVTANPTPQQVGGNHTWLSITAGKHHTCGLTSAGRAYCWGRGSDGQLGNSQTTNKPLPDSVRTSETFTALTAGAAHTCGITTRGIILCWGAVASGRLGNEGVQNQLLPDRVHEPR